MEATLEQRLASLETRHDAAVKEFNEKLDLLAEQHGIERGKLLASLNEAIETVNKVVDYVKNLHNNPDFVMAVMTQAVRAYDKTQLDLIANEALNVSLKISKEPISETSMRASIVFVPLNAESDETVASCKLESKDENGEWVELPADNEATEALALVVLQEATKDGYAMGAYFYATAVKAEKPAESADATEALPEAPSLTLQ